MLRARGAGCSEHVARDAQSTWRGMLRARNGRRSEHFRIDASDRRRPCGERYPDRRGTNGFLRTQVGLADANDDALRTEEGRLDEADDQAARRLRLEPQPKSSAANVACEDGRPADANPDRPRRERSATNNDPATREASARHPQ